MSRPKADFLIPRLNPALSPDRLEKILTGEEIRIIQFIDGETSCSLLARLLGYSGDSLQALLTTLANRGVVQLGYRTSDELDFEDYQESPGTSPGDADKRTPSNGVGLVAEGPNSDSVPRSLLDDLSPAIAEQSLTPGEIRLLVFIDGGTSIQNLATLLGSSTEEVLESTKKLASQGFITFGDQEEISPSEMTSPGFGSLPESVQEVVASYSQGGSSGQMEAVSNDNFSEDTSLDPGASLLNLSAFRSNDEQENSQLALAEEDELELELEGGPEEEEPHAMVFSSEDLPQGSLEEPLLEEFQEDEEEAVLTFSSVEVSKEPEGPESLAEELPSGQFEVDSQSELSLPTEDSYETEAALADEMSVSSFLDSAEESEEKQSPDTQDTALATPGSQSLMAAAFVPEQEEGNPDLASQEQSLGQGGLHSHEWEPGMASGAAPVLSLESEAYEEDAAQALSLETPPTNTTGDSVFYSAEEEQSWSAPEAEVESTRGVTGSSEALSLLPASPPMLSSPAEEEERWLDLEDEPDSFGMIPRELVSPEDMSPDDLEKLARQQAMEEAEQRDFLEWFSSVDVEEELDTESSKQVANIMRALARVTNSLLFYEPRNKAVRNALASFYSRITSFLKSYDSLRLNIEPWDIQYEGEVVYRNRDREHSLAYKLFRDGVRGVIFRRGINWSELSRFLKILGVRYNGVHLFEEDIVTMLWKESFQSIEILAVEGTDLREEKAPLKEFAEELFSEVFDASEGENQKEKYFYLEQLTHEESPQLLLQHLHPRGYGYSVIPEKVTERLKQEFDIQLLSDRVFRLLDYLELECIDPEHPWEGQELVELLAEFRDFLLADGLLEELYHLLVRVHDWKKRATHDPLYKQLGLLSQDLLREFQEQRIMKRFLDSLSLREGGQIPARVFSILEMLDFDKVALFLDLLKESKTRHLRDILIQLLLEITDKDVKLFVTLMKKSEGELRMALLRCLQGFQTEEAVIAIVGQLGHSNPEVRRLVVEIVDELISENNAGATVYKVITKLIEDPEPRIRNRAYKLIQLSNDKRWGRTLLRLLQSETGYTKDEQIRIARLFAWLTPDEAEPVLLEMARPAGFFTLDTGSMQDKRRIAVNALGMIRSKAAEDMVKLVRQKLSMELEQECIEALREMRRDDLEEAINKTLFVQEIDNLMMSQEALPAVNDSKGEEEKEEGFVHQDEVEKMSEEEADKVFLQDLEDSDLKEVDVQNIQVQLMKELTQAGADSEQSNVYHKQLRRYGQRLVLMLHMLVVSARLYGKNNRVFEKPLEDLMDLMVRLNRLVVEFSLTWIEGQFYLNETRIRMRGENARVGEALFVELDKMGLGGFTFSVPMQPEQLYKLVQLLSGTSEHGLLRTLENFQIACQREGLDSYLSVTGRLAYRLMEETKEVTTSNLVSNYAQGIQAADSLWSSASAGRLPNPVPVRRCINDFVDALAENDQSTLEVIALEDNSNPLQAHFLRVALFSTMIGMEMGLPPTSLSDLGLSAFFHDIGYACSEEVLDETALRNSAQRVLHAHEGTEPETLSPTPLEHHRKGLRLLVRQRGFHDAKINRLLAVFEHHFPFQHQFSYMPNLFSRIIRVADTFDTLTSSLFPEPLVSPDRALGVLMAGAGLYFDPVAVQALINRLGRFPLGSILELNDGTLVISMGYDGEPHRFERPTVLVFRTSPQGTLPEGQIVDLSNEEFQEVQIVGVHKDSSEFNARHRLAITLKKRLRVERVMRMSEAGLDAFSEYS